LGRGKWPNRDPIAEIGGLNLYGFCLNNSAYYFDPLGATWWNPFSWFGHDGDKEGAGEAAQKAADCAKKACEDRANKPISGAEPLPGSGAAGAAGAVGGAIIEVGTGLLQAGPGLTAVGALNGPNSPCTKLKKCLSEHACDPDGGKECDKYQQACEALKKQLQTPIQGLLK
jgi:hypothetical protein